MIIVDTNVCNEIARPCKPMYIPLVKCISNVKSAKFVTGGKHLSEVKKCSARFISLLNEWKMADKLFIVDSVAIESDQLKVDGITAKYSIRIDNDHHIISLARVSGSRCLATRDKNLMDAFRNRKLLSPRGKIYSYTSAKVVLRAFK